jgi:inosine/xanthosine triphosphate pyrophosphatase family protein
MPKRVLVVATRNRGKINEFRSFLSGFDVEIRSMDDFGPIPQPVEDGGSFEENAYKKASHTAEEKNAVSHRGRAMKELRSEFDKVLVWLKQRLGD